MKTYKITNVTNLFGKRDSQFNSVINIDYIDKRTRKVITLKPNETVYLTVQSLPLSVRKMNLKKMIDVIEVNLKSVEKKLIPKNKNKTVNKKINEKKITTTKPKKKTIRKKEIDTKEIVD